MDLRKCSAREFGRRLACTVFFAVAVAPAHAGDVSTTSCYDTFINSFHPDNNNGGDTSFFTGRSGEGGVMRGLLRCDLPAGIDERVMVTQVTLTLTTVGLGATGTSNPTAATETLRAITEAWGEGNKVGNTAMTYTVGQPCTAGEATWNARECAVANWTSGGGTVSGSPSASTSSPASIGASVSFTSTSGGMVTDVSNWIATPSSNNGWLVQSSTETPSNGLAQRFVSREASSGRPVLAVKYACNSGFSDTGTGCTACTSTAQAACVTSEPDNTCNDPGAPSNYSCTCGNPAYTGTGTQSCTDLNECVPNLCVAAGDAGAVCTDHVAPATGYDCSCDAGFVFDGITCSDRIFADAFDGP